MAGDPGQSDVWDSPIFVVGAGALVGVVIVLGGWALHSLGAPASVFGAGVTGCVGVVGLVTAYRWRTQLRAAKSIEQGRDLLRSLFDVEARLGAYAHATVVEWSCRVREVEGEHSASQTGHRSNEARREADSARVARAQSERESAHSALVSSTAAFRAEAILASPFDESAGPLCDAVVAALARVPAEVENHILYEVAPGRHMLGPEHDVLDGLAAYAKRIAEPGHELHDTMTAVQRHVSATLRAAVGARPRNGGPRDAPRIQGRDR